MRLIFKHSFEQKIGLPHSKYEDKTVTLINNKERKTTNVVFVSENGLELTRMRLELPCSYNSNLDIKRYRLNLTINGEKHATDRIFETQSNKPLIFSEDLAKVDVCEVVVLSCYEQEVKYAWKTFSSDIKMGDFVAELRSAGIKFPLKVNPNSYLWEYINQIYSHANSYYPLTITPERITWAEGEEVIPLTDVILARLAHDSNIEIETFRNTRTIRCQSVKEAEKYVGVINAILRHPLYMVQCLGAAYISLANMQTKDGQYLPSDVIETILRIARGSH